MTHDERRGTVGAPISKDSGVVRYQTLKDWLAYQETLHPNAIDLGLDRIRRVLDTLQWTQFQCPVITVGGTNGKGSCVALLESILTVHGYRVGTFTSPHLVRYNERIRIDGDEVSDAELMAAFERIEAARGDISITFFEFNTLAALLTFATRNLDAVVLEVGLGGRLDAVNVVDADVAIVSSIALDHCEWLGHDVESIARWKAGIFRPDRAAVFGSRNMPSAIKEEADRIGAQLWRLGVEFTVESERAASEKDGWNWQGRVQHVGLPLPGLPGAVQLENAGAVLTALDCLRDRLPVTRRSIDAGLKSVRLAGRFEIVRAESPPREWILDVAHNPAAAAMLAQNLKTRPCSGKTIAVCGMFADKDIDGVIAAVGAQMDSWVVATVSGGRAMAAELLAAKVTNSGGRIAAVAPDVVTACSRAQSMAAAADRIVVFGSFHTVGPALAWLRGTTRVRADAT